MRDRVERLLEVQEAHIEWLLMLACLVNQYSWSRDLVSSPPTLSESCLLVCNVCFGLHSDPFQYDPKKELAFIGNQSNCSVVFTLFKVTFLGKWDECEERPFLRHSPVSQFGRHNIHGPKIKGLSPFGEGSWFSS